MTISLVQDMVTFLNIFPSKNGISSELIPAESTLGYPNTDYNKIIIKLGGYAQVYIRTTNINDHRTVG